jgi:hypothetical protein
MYDGTYKKRTASKGCDITQGKGNSYWTTLNYIREYDFFLDLLMIV